MQQEKKVTLLCGKNDCCPIITVAKKEVTITDDFNGKATLTREQFDILKTKIKEELI